MRMLAGKIVHFLHIPQAIEEVHKTTVRTVGPSSVEVISLPIRSPLASFRSFDALCWMTITGCCFAAILPLATAVLLSQCRTE